MVDYLHDFRNSRYATMLAAQIRELAPTRPVNLMEICGGHTIAIFKFGIRDLLPETIRLLSGPGCPVCVTANDFIDKAIEIGRLKDVILCSFGDMLKVPGSRGSLQQEKAAGRDVRICLSAADAVKIAAANPARRVVFLGIGFETTAPTIAASVKMARTQALGNYFILTAMKTMPQALAALIESEDFNVQGFICPGHVSTITGTGIYASIVEKYRIPCVVSGFEPLDILQSVKMLAEQLAAGRAQTGIQYTRSVNSEGNALACRIMDEVLEPCDVPWRGLGVIPGSGLRLREAFAEFDAEREFDDSIVIPEPRTTPGCICGQIMRGVQTPLECKLFAGACTPLNPRGACMVSAEGTCATYYKYNRGKLNG